MRAAVINDTRNIVAIDGEADCVSKTSRSKPGSLPFGQRLRRRFVKPQGLGIERGAERARRAWHSLFDAIETSGSQLRDDIGFAAQEVLEFQIVILLNPNADGIEIRQLFAG